jgi:signal transduction histidine kinase
VTHWLETVVTLLTANTADLRELALIAGGDPATFYLGVDVSKIDFSGQDIRGMEFSAPANSNTELVRAAKKLEEEKQEALTARDAAVRSDRAKSHFIANVSHELRNPLNAILGFADLLLQDGTLSAKQRQYIEGIAVASDAMRRMASDLTDLSGIENGTLFLSMEDVDLHELAEEIMKMFGPATAAAGMKLKFDIHVEHPIRADSRRLRQILVNLIDNAIRYARTGVVLVRANADDSKRATTLFEVIDSGLDVFPSLINGDVDLFVENARDYRRADRRGDTGSNMGLSICRGLVGLMAGEMGVKVVPGGGCNFWFRLPAS